MILSIVGRRFEPSPATKRLIEAVGKDMHRAFKHVVSVEWTLERERGLATAGCRLHSRSGYYRASARAKTMEEAIGAVVDRLISQRRRRKAALVRRRRSAPTAVPPGRVRGR